MQTVILHDLRLDGKVAGHGQVIEVDGTTPLAHAFRRVLQAANSSPCQLAIACHGFMSHYHNRGSHETLQGGTGLQLCRELLRIRNVGQVSDLRGRFERIWLMACGPAGTIVHDSRPFCREFAAFADTPVVAADRPQLYHPGTHDNSQRVSRRTLRFGDWEGSVYEFRPDGTVHPTTGAGSPLP